MIPMGVAFDELKLEKSKFVEVLDRIIDTAFGLDIIFNFRTSFINPKTGIEVTSSKRIAKSYVLAGRFFIDLLASLPFELIYSGF